MLLEIISWIYCIHAILFVVYVFIWNTKRLYWILKHYKPKHNKTTGYYLEYFNVRPFGIKDFTAEDIQMFKNYLRELKNQKE